MTEVSDKIATRRKELGLTDTEVAQQSGLSIHEYCDIEQHANEIYTNVRIQAVKKLSDILRVDLLSLFEIPCAFCADDRNYTEEYSLPRNELIRKKREAKGLSTEELGDRIDFYGTEIEKLEAGPEYIESWPLEFIRKLADEIGVPLQILLSVKCMKCGR
jgi:transcriptional regulator with XRE-family HTH domain